MSKEKIVSNYPAGSILSLIQSLPAPAKALHGRGGEWRRISTLDLRKKAHKRLWAAIPELHRFEVAGSRYQAGEKRVSPELYELVCSRPGKWTALLAEAERRWPTGWAGAGIRL